jgi:sulfite reductase (NADPH) flavoprotein alpha-component
MSRPFSRVHVLFGTETGNSELVALDLKTAAEERGLEVTFARLDDCPPEKFPADGCVLIVCATTGDGEMPYNAEGFWEAFSADGVPRLEGLSYSVLGLGDTGYYDFCQAAIDIDNRFEALGAHRLRPLVMCDVVFEDDAEAWTADILDVVTGAVEEADPAPEQRITIPAARTHGAPARIRHSRWLSGPGALKQVRHVELSLEGCDLTYRTGDSLGIVPHNDPALVDAVLAHLGRSGDEDAGGRTLREALTTEYEISRPSRELVEEIARRSHDPELTRLVGGDDRRALHEYLWARDVLDLLPLATDPALTPEDALGLLRPLAHRSYSIASSPLVDPLRVDLTVATLRYTAAGRDRGGVASTHLADRLTEGDVAEVVLVPNEVFRPPTDGSADIIMIGPGTGVAPFRGFLQERRATGATGRNWLFFGSRHRRCDHLYGEEFAEMHSSGLLTRWDVAFSRDQASKVYVQDKMREQGKALVEWLNDGAHLYVCGDAVAMAGDVDRALHEIVAEFGGMSADDAHAYVSTLDREHRYLRDVY